jgi:amidase
MSGYEPGDATWAPPPEEPFPASAAREPGRLRIGWSVKPALVGTPVDPVSAWAVGEAAELLDELGHDVEEVEAPWGEDDLFEAFTDVFTISSAQGVAFGGLIAGRQPTPHDVEKLTWWAYERARSLDSLGYSMALTGLQAAARELVAFCLGYDAVLTPVVAERPLPIGTIDTEAADPAATFRRSAEFAPFTAVFNLTGQPAISVPLFHGDDGLPLAVHIVGPPLGEALLLSLAAQLEAARPWHERVPALAA